MKAKFEGDRKKRVLVLKYENKRRSLHKEILQALHFNDIEALEKKRKALHKLPRNSSPTRVGNRCIITGRSRSVYRYFKMSRIELRRRAGNSGIPGLRKASWLSHPSHLENGPTIMRNLFEIYSKFIRNCSHGGIGRRDRFKICYIYMYWFNSS